MTNLIYLNFISAGNETNGKYLLSKTIVTAGDKGPPPYIHTREDEGFYLEKEELTVFVNHLKIHMKTGNFLNIEKRQKHKWRNEGPEDAELLITFAPAGIEHMFIELEDTLKNIVANGKRHGTEFLMD